MDNNDQHRATAFAITQHIDQVCGRKGRLSSNSGDWVADYTSKTLHPVVRIRFLPERIRALGIDIYESEFDYEDPDMLDKLANSVRRRLGPKEQEDLGRLGPKEQEDTE